MVNQLKLPTPKKILVLGDLILDLYTHGEVSQVSPEAPIPILLEKTEEIKLGGACNVAKNLLSLGMEVTLVGRIGRDQEGLELIKQLDSQKIESRFILVDEGVSTTKKKRFIAAGQQILRVDREKAEPLSIDLERQLLEKIKPILFQFNAIVFSDYAKGFLTSSFLQALIEEAKNSKIPIVVDPKGKDFSKYCGATVIKPNEKEAYLATPYSKEEGLEKIANYLLKQIQIDTLFITRASRGISLYTSSSKTHFSVAVNDVIDVTGAGDTVLAMLSACMADNITLKDAAQLANIAASISIEQLGCVSVTMQQIYQRMLQLDGSNKVFYKENEELLTLLLKDKSFILFLVEENSLTMDLFDKIKDQKIKNKLVVCCVSTKKPIVKVLESINYVDYIAVGTSLGKEGIPIENSLLLTSGL